MLYKDLVIINNEKFFKENDNFYCDNLDLKILPEGLNDYHQVQYIVRSSKIKKDQKIGKFLDGNNIIRSIFVKNKLINLIIK